ncbi:hypothetical protein [Lacrimispora amygdalina]|uniref:hypothetical protein n=1 Tax=Lacrimispora amygdalina TaxID=253257 RepID=UPI000BE27775|nr:hypothetical protein [Lacrimispora amygdalina]
MKIRSEITDAVEDIEFDVNLYDAGNGKKGIKHESLEDILYNRMPKELDVNHDIQIITASASYCAVKCTITDIKGRKVYGCNDVSLEHLEKEDAFVKQHPLTQAIQSAMDSAVKSYLKWPRLLPGEDKTSAATSVIDDSGIVLPPNEEVAAVEESITEADENFEMNSPEYSDESDLGPDETNEKSEGEEDFSNYSIEELGKLLIPIGTYKDKAIEEVWESNPTWFTFVLKQSRSPKYDFAREYARRKGIQ